MSRWKWVKIQYNCGGKTKEILDFFPSRAIFDLKQLKEKIMKKKILIALAVLMLLAPSLFAQKMKGMGGLGVSYMNTTRMGEGFGSSDGYKINIMSNVPSINGFTYIGDLVGFYGAFNIGIPLDQTVSFTDPNGNSDGSEYYDSLASTHDYIFLDVILGIGTNISFGNTMGVLVGGGLDYSMMYLKKKGLSESYAYIDQMLGLGGDARIWLAITPMICFDIGVTVSYDFLPLWKSEQQLYENTKIVQALNMGINVGLALKF